ncbi:hypothetical protein [Chlamydiifrater volucris]|uniref:hypothetical protein n=1 Tax=Chlamydiifrater volucris TaxID=2681470 RepID=UPI001BD0F8EA|nr:hypothetical protein [Chlamydiifrater volucris]
MNNKSTQQILDSIKQILQIYKIDIDTSFENALSSGEEADYQYLIEKTQEKIEELDKKSKEILKQTGMTEQEMEVFARNPDNFSPEEWLALEKVRSSCEAYKRETEAIIDDISRGIGLNTPSTAQQKTPSKSGEKKNKKKNWIPL